LLIQTTRLQKSYGGGEVEDKRGWLGQYEIIADDERFVIDNLITDAGLDMVRNALNGELASTEIRYLAVGTSATTPSTTQTQLGAEIFRTSFITSTKPATGQLEKTAVILETEAVANIREIGIFAGSTATTTANSGIMISRVLYSRNKTNLESIQIVRRDTIQRG
jgi:hypothetical protein